MSHFKFGEADGVIGLDILSSFKTVTFDFKTLFLFCRTGNAEFQLSRYRVGAWVGEPG